MHVAACNGLVRLEAHERRICEWCSALVARDPDTDDFPRDGDGDVTCRECLRLPAYHVPAGRA